MTTSDLAALLNPETLADPAGRLVLADALEDGGRTREAAVCRCGLPVRLATAYGSFMGRVMPELQPCSGGLQRLDDDGSQWLNCHWEGEPFGGGWVPWDGDEVEPYGDDELGVDPTPEGIRNVFGLNLDEDEAAELAEMVRAESVRLIRRQLRL